jgi:hypothetical protein
LPPFEDILVLAKRCPHGKVGLSKCMNIMSIDDYEVIDIENSHIEAIIVNKKILIKLPPEKIIKILEQNVFPYISSGEMIRVDFNIKITCKKVEGTIA